MGTRTRSKSSPVVLENIVDTGTEGTKVAVGNEAQRGSTTGQWRYLSLIHISEPTRRYEISYSVMLM